MPSDSFTNNPPRVKSQVLSAKQSIRTRFSWPAGTKILPHPYPPAGYQPSKDDWRVRNTRLPRSVRPLKTTPIQETAIANDLVIEPNSARSDAVDYLLNAFRAAILQGDQRGNDRAQAHGEDDDLYGDDEDANGAGQIGGAGDPGDDDSPSSDDNSDDDDEDDGSDESSQGESSDDDEVSEKGDTPDSSETTASNSSRVHTPDYSSVSEPRSDPNDLTYEYSSPETDREEYIQVRRVHRVPEVPQPQEGEEREVCGDRQVPGDRQVSEDRDAPEAPQVPDQPQDLDILPGSDDLAGPDILLNPGFLPAPEIDQIPEHGWLAHEPVPGQPEPRYILVAREMHRIAADQFLENSIGARPVLSPREDNEIDILFGWWFVDPRVDRRTLRNPPIDMNNCDTILANSPSTSTLRWLAPFAVEGNGAPDNDMTPLERRELIIRQWRIFWNEDGPVDRW